MFDSLKKKFNEWFGKEEPKKKKIVVKRRESAVEKKVKKIKEKAKKEIVEEKLKEECEAVEEKITEGGEAAAEEKEGFFARFSKKLTLSELGAGDFEEFFDEFEAVLLEHNVALEVVDEIRKKLREDLVGKKFGKSEVRGKIFEALKNAIDSVLVEGEDFVKMIKAKSEKPFVILFFGINGSGKTTTIAKIAYLLKAKGLRVVMAAADTFRAASIEQLEKHGERLKIEVVKQQYGADPAAVAFDAIQHARKNFFDVVLIDTAGRMYTRANLIREMEKIVRVAKPDMKIFVGESITGNDATEQARTFNDAVGIDGIVLSKADVDDKAGTILSAGFVTSKPILFLGVGQDYEDLKEFRKKDVFEGLGLGG